MKTKNLFCLLLTLILCLAAFSACAKKPADETEATAAADDAEETAANDAEETTAAEEETEAPEENEEFVPEADRTTANFAGTYGFERCTIVATAIDENTMEFNVHWGSSAFEAEEWVMTGTLDPDTMRVNYSDCVRKTVVYAEDGTGTETVAYEDGCGRIQFLDLNTLIWEDEQDNIASGMTFSR